MSKPDMVFLFTNRNCLVFDEEGEQMPELQSAITCYSLDKEKAQALADSAREFNLSKFQVWSQEISKREFEYLLGLRTRDRDLKDLDSDA